ncbi:hypothetical protein Taro_016710 [Colocasia esculenta]|uniref:Trichome birefringence-like C-terminal domain-containing protein n=1 Tax=Colocasia esculenta TaxID=4460 RepID=A0A843UEG9_COLES|nr:hypothetical protein [Colocasia esculenta]
MPSSTRCRTTGLTTEQQVWLTEQATCSVPSSQENPSGPSSPHGSYNGYVENPRDVSDTTDQNFRRMHYEAHNFTLSIFWSPFLVRSEDGRLPGLSWSGLWNLYLDEADPAWTSQLGGFDFLIISGGNWFTRPSVFYEKHRIVGSNYYLLRNIKVLNLEYANWKAFRAAFDAINKAGRAGRFRGDVFLRTLSPSHFENGQWDSGGDCVRKWPFRRNETRMMPMEEKLYKQQLVEFRRAKAEAKKRKKGVRFRLLEATAAMLLRPDGHPSRYGHWQDQNVVLRNDCVHWCLPGPVDMWNDIFLQMLKDPYA